MLYLRSGYQLECYYGDYEWAVVRTAVSSTNSLIVMARLTLHRRPYSSSPAAQSLIFASPLVGSLIGTLLCGSAADAIANYYTLRNHGIRKSEMRLPTCIIAAFLTFVGALIAGLCLHCQTQWIGPIFAMAFSAPAGRWVQRLP